MNEKTITKKATIVIGKVIKPHGIHGGAKIKPFTENLDSLADYDRFLLDGDPRQVLKVVSVAPQNGFFIMYFEGIETIEQVDQLRNKLLTVSRETLAEKKAMGSTEVLIDDLIGYRVYNEQDEYLGEVEGFYHGGVNGLYMVKTNEEEFDGQPLEKKRNRDFFIPCSMGFYQKIDFDQQRIYLSSDSIVI